MQPLRYLSRTFAPLLAISVGLVVALLAGPLATETLPGPLPARVLEVIDGDSLDVRARIWLGQEVRIRVRLAGIDTPERRGRCPEERAAAAAAKQRLAVLAGTGEVWLLDIRYGKFAGRVLARVLDARNRDFAREMLRSGHARAYDGGRRPDWCALLAAESGG